MMRSIARRCVSLRFGASRSEHFRLDRLGKAPASCGSRLPRNFRGYGPASTWITLSFMDQNVCRRLMPRPELGRSHPTAAAAAPATFHLVHLQVVGREHMAIAADTGYGHGFGDRFQGKAHHISFGCSKARPRYHLQRIASSCNGLPPWTAPVRSRRPDDPVPRTAAY
jgi:hypothetical protein